VGKRGRKKRENWQELAAAAGGEGGKKRETAALEVANASMVDLVPLGDDRFLFT